jgi:hypothetical protein
MSEKIFKVTKEIFDKIDKESCAMDDLDCSKCPFSFVDYIGFSSTSDECIFDKIDIVPFLVIEEDL